MYFSREDSYISHYFLCRPISLLKNTKFPTKWLHFPGRSFLISTFFPTMMLMLQSLHTLSNSLNAAEAFPILLFSSLTLVVHHLDKIFITECAYGVVEMLT